MVKYILSKIFENYTEDFLSVKLKLFYKECKKKKKSFKFFYESCKNKRFSHFHKTILFPTKQHIQMEYSQLPHIIRRRKENQGKCKLNIPNFQKTE